MERKDCIVIPQTATFELQDRIFVYKVVNGKAESAEIRVSPQNNGTEYIVEDGLSTGDVIVAEGAGLLKEGTEIKAK
jgi:membrane fusion protein (multidrug efflux system)